MYELTITAGGKPTPREALKLLERGGVVVHQARINGEPVAFGGPPANDVEARQKRAEARAAAKSAKK